MQLSFPKYTEAFAGILKLEKKVCWLATSPLALTYKPNLSLNKFS